MNDYSVYNPSIKERIAMFSAVALVLEIIAVLIYNTKLGIVLSPAIYPLVEKKYRQIMIKRRKDRLRSQFKDLLYSLSSAFATGEHMSSAMEKSIAVIDDIHGKNSDMSMELRCMVGQIIEAGEDETELWRDFGRRSKVEDIQDFADVFASCRDAGGNLVRTVDRAAEILSEKIGVENDIRVMASQKVTEGRLVGVMPILMIVFLRMTSPSYMRVMYESLAGRVIMTLSMAITIAAFWITEKVTRIEV